MASVQRQHRCDCNKRFATVRALAQHKRDSPRHPNGQGQASAPNTVAPTLLSTDEVAGAVVIPAASTEPTASVNTSTPAIAGQSPSTAQKKKEKKKKKPKNKKKGSKTGAAGQPAVSYASSTSSDGYILRQHYNPGWEWEYRMGGPDHTQCSRDCDWCGACVYREPY